MIDTKNNPKVDAYLDREKTWRKEFEALRAILRDFDLSEDFKWGHPCYALGKANIVLMHGFKEYCALLFFKGALMKDPSGILIQQTENVQAARQIRFTSADEIRRMANALKSYVQEAIEVEKAGLKVEFKKDFDVPEEFQAKLDARPELKSAFEALTPGRQRAYILHFSGAKQAKTREERVAKCISRILEGKGIDD